MDLSQRSQFFTLHIWKEELGDQRCEWRGRIRHVPSGEVCYFRDWTVLVQFLDRFASSQGESHGATHGGPTPAVI